MVPPDVHTQIESIVASGANNALAKPDLNPQALFWWKASKSNAFSSATLCNRAGGGTKPANLQLVLVVMHSQLTLYGSAQDVPEMNFTVSFYNWLPWFFFPLDLVLHAQVQKPQGREEQAMARNAQRLAPELAPAEEDAI